jgi:hypothetical protein
VESRDGAFNVTHVVPAGQADKNKILVGMSVSGVNGVSLDDLGISNDKELGAFVAKAGRPLTFNFDGIRRAPFVQLPRRSKLFNEDPHFADWMEQRMPLSVIRSLHTHWPVVVSHYAEAPSYTDEL